MVPKNHFKVLFSFYDKFTFWFNKVDKTTRYRIEGIKPHTTYDETNLFIAKMAKLSDSDNYVFADFGCGLGRPTLDIARAYTKTKFYFVNVYKKQLDFFQTSRNCVKLNEDYYSTSLESESVDAVLFYESFSHSYNQKVAIKEISRVLKRKGRLIIIDYLCDPRARKEQIQAYTNTMSMYLIKPKKLKHLLQQNGFKQILYDINVKNYLKLNNSNYDDNYIFYRDKTLSDFGDLVAEIANTQAYIALPSIIVFEKS